MMIGININATTAEESEKIKAIEKVVRDAYEILTPQNKEFSLKDIKDSIVKTGDSHIPIQLERYLANPLLIKLMTHCNLIRNSQHLIWTLLLMMRKMQD